MGRARMVVAAAVWVGRRGGRAAGGWRLLAVVVVFSQDRFCRVS